MQVRSANFLASAAHPREYPPAGPPEVAFAGRSNVGKSSLINSLLGRRKLVRVSATPGRTRRINFFSINRDELRFVDLPGYGFAKVPMHMRAAWGPMIERYITTRPTLAAVVVILDIRHEPTAMDLQLIEWLGAVGRRAVVVLTKADKLSRSRQIARQKKLSQQLGVAPLIYSARTHHGREELWGVISGLIAQDS